MKKLLVLALVLSIASLASAATIEVAAIQTGAGGVITGFTKGDVALGDWTAGTYDLTVLVNSPIGGFDATIKASGDVTITNKGNLVLPPPTNMVMAVPNQPITVNAALGLSVISDTSNPAAGLKYAAVAAGAGSTFGSENLMVIYQFQAIVGADGGSIGFVVNTDASGQAALVLGNGTKVLGDQGFGSLTFVPEPMTLALLGLGGLFIRRKK